VKWGLRTEGGHADGLREEALDVAVEYGACYLLPSREVACVLGRCCVRVGYCFSLLVVAVKCEDGIA